MMPKAICVWGDSLAKGIVYDENRGRYAILRENCLRMLEQKLQVPVHNYAVMGCTASDCLKQISEDELVPGGEEVDAVGGPVLGLRRAAGLVEEGLQRDERGAELLRELLREGAAYPDLGGEVLAGAEGQGEGLQKHEPDGG